MKDSYLIYILACSFAIGMFSILLSLVDNPRLKSGISSWSASLNNVTLGFSVLFIFCVFVYMGFVGGFFIKQQTHEFKTFEKFGMSRWTIIVIGFIQTVVVQLISWLIGIIIALIFQKFFGMLLLYLMGVKTGFLFRFTGNTFSMLWQICLYSTIVFSIMNSFRVQKLLRKNKDKSKRLPKWYIRLLGGILGILLFFSGIVVTVILFGDIKNNNQTAAIVELSFLFVAYLAGTYLMYYGFLPSFLTILQHTKGIAYTGINIFSFKYFKERLMRNVSILWFITELSSLALILLSVCYFGYKSVYTNYTYAHPFELTANQNTVKPIKKYLKENNAKITRSYKTNVKTTVVQRGSNNEILPGTFISYSDYQKLPKSNVARNPQITKNEFLVLDYGYVPSFASDKSNTAVVKVKNARIIKTNKIGSAFPYGSTMYQGLMIVAPDKYYQKLKPEVKNTFYGWFFKSGDSLTHKQYEKLNKQEYTSGVQIKKAADLADTKLTTDTNRRNVSGTTVYMDSNFSRQKNAKSQVDQISGFGIFIVAMFSVSLLIALGSVLTLRLLLRDDSEWKQLKTLNKIGVSKSEIKEIVKKETIYSFVIPIIFAVMQSYIVMALIARYPRTTMLRPFILINLGYIALYGIIGFVTYLISWRSVNQKLT